jgi:DNA-binding transcriptional LysR family regulator
MDPTRRLFTQEPLIFMAEQGMGIAYLPDFAISRQLREGVLVTVLDDYTDFVAVLSASSFTFAHAS